MTLFRFERREQPLASHIAFAGRLVGSIFAATIIVAVVLFAGMTGYRLTEHMSWLEAFLNAAMLLGGMGPVDILKSDAGKLFAGSYALVCGLVIVVTTAIVLSPVLHRVLHAIHVDCEDKL